MQISEKVWASVKGLWQKANSFITIVSDKRGSDRIVNDLKKAYNLSLGRGTSLQVSDHNVILDKLFDIARCKCPIVSCEKSNCESNQSKIKFLLLNFNL